VKWAGSRPPSTSSPPSCEVGSLVCLLGVGWFGVGWFELVGRLVGSFDYVLGVAGWRGAFALSNCCLWEERDHPPPNPQPPAQQHAGGEQPAAAPVEPEGEERLRHRAQLDQAVEGRDCAGHGDLGEAHALPRSNLIRTEWLGLGLRLCFSGDAVRLNRPTGVVETKPIPQTRPQKRGQAETPGTRPPSRRPRPRSSLPPTRMPAEGEGAGSSGALAGFWAGIQSRAPACEHHLPRRCRPGLPWPTSSCPAHPSPSAHPLPSRLPPTVKLCHEEGQARLVDGLSKRLVGDL
jgi:hypothetical protein